MRRNERGEVVLALTPVQLTVLLAAVLLGLVVIGRRRRG